MTKQQFLSAIIPAALENYKKYNILPSLTLAQACLESAWGKSHIEHNLFGIKAGSSWTGKVAIRKTKEYVNGQWITIDAKFRAYSNFGDSVRDHGKLLCNTRYAKVRQARTYREACQEVWKAGYATDPNYPAKLIQLIESNQFQKYDEVKDMSIDEALKILKDNGIINTPEYWKQNAVKGGTVKGEYAAALIQNMAKKLGGK